MKPSRIKRSKMWVEGLRLWLKEKDKKNCCPAGLVKFNEDLISLQDTFCKRCEALFPDSAPMCPCNCGEYTENQVISTVRAFLKTCKEA